MSKTTQPNNTDNLASEASADLSSRFIIPELNLRAVRLRLHESFMQIISQHAYPPVIASWLGEALIANTLATGLLKFSGRVVMHIQNKNSPLKLLSCKCNDLNEISGLVHWDKQATEKQLQDATLQGQLTISIMQQQQPYQSITALDGKSITATLSHYFNQSEQLPTRIFFCQSDTEHLEGLLLQHIPTSSNDAPADASQTESLLNAIDESLIISSMQSQESGAELLTKLFPEQDILHQQDNSISFKCSCDKKRMQNALISMGPKECETILAKHHIISVQCEFCSKEENFNRSQVEKLWH